MTKKEEGVSYIRIDSPLEARREILNAAIESTYILKYIEHYKRIRSKKLEKVQEINRLMTKISKEVTNLKRALPKESEIEGLKPVELKSVVKKEPAKKTEPRDSIERDLDEIRKRLDSIGS